MKDSEDEASGDSEPEMFDNVMEKSSLGPQIIEQSASDVSEKEDSPVKPPPKRKLGPKPTKRKIESSESEISPSKKKVY